MPSWWTEKPLLIAVAVLFGIVFLRAQLTYWVGRAAAVGVSHTRWSEKLNGPKAARASGLLIRWGPPVITISFLTVGFQTVANFSAGLIRMPFLRYLLAMIIGCLAWSVLYATVGLAAIGVALALAAHSHWTLVAVGFAVAVLVGALLHRRRSTRGV